MTDNQTVQAYTEAWTQAIEAISELVTPLPENSWNRATECPGWSVRDVVSHVIAVESELLGDPRPIHSLPRDLRHVASDYARYIELPVDKRRCHTALEMTSELEYTIIRRSRALRNAKQTPTEPVRRPGGPHGRDVPYHELLRLRAFDVWVHQQDLRRALGLPGDLDSPAALIARDVLLEALPKAVAHQAGAPAGTALVVDVTGRVEFLRTVRVDSAGRGTVDESISLAPDVQLTLDWETYVRLACGRGRPGPVAVEGDKELADRVLTNFAVTP
ncbi:MULTISPECIES: maleylpyruvate isomerase family mycothiol-dependent enzyme [unclassified Streptomyces]|uniref:maleylpyruvate isomerase family mycothiol-dependent enzyme n=1 Tax=Streptomycetaceae TaxID=2062 RepID=UPI002E7A65AB|nr:MULTISPECIES: maleylpyruvate isomerase family mycothiol-dependent enzyme [unclassified Streptomyces]MED7948709.1 maleylpyruvate isomerase family mycothiol-dependent enzyme [Streptomyces sp. BE303]MEE1828349.1 maleylpyruvate isomerase family mycothiol-dependent enzyme [Streptomyces sp. BE20]